MALCFAFESCDRFLVVCICSIAGAVLLFVPGSHSCLGVKCLFWGALIGICLYRLVLFSFVLLWRPSFWTWVLVVLLFLLLLVSLGSFVHFGISAFVISMS